MKEATKKYENIEVKKLEHSEVEITGTIPTDAFEKHRARALKSLNDEVTIDGFRKGKVPENVLIQKVGDMVILEEMAELAIADAYPEIIDDQKIDVLGRPRVQITKLAKGSPLEFKVKTAVLPEVTLPDYKKIAKEEMTKKEDPVKVEEKEIEDLIIQIRKSRVDHSKHDHSLSKEEHDKQLEKEMPELTDEFVQALGDFKDIVDFRAKMKDSLKLEKEQKAKEKKRIKIAEALIEATKVDLPHIVVEAELDKMESQFEDDIARMGVKPEEYLKHIKKSREDLRKEWRKDAEKKAIFQLVLNKISLEEKIVADPKDVEREVSHILDHYKKADPERARVYAASLLTNDKVFEFLESQK